MTAIARHLPRRIPIGQLPYAKQSRVLAFMRPPTDGTATMTSMAFSIGNIASRRHDSYPEFEVREARERYL